MERQGPIGDRPLEGRRPGTELVLFIGLAGYTAALVILLVHEVLGHGLTSVLLGGSFSDFFVSPLAGSANVATPDGVNPISTAAGSVVTLAFGFAVWGWLRARLGAAEPKPVAATILLWCVANEAILDQILYATMQPALATVIGLSTGDWWSLADRWGLSPVILLAAGLAIGVPLSALLVRDGYGIVSRSVLPGTSAGPLATYWLLTLPGAALQLAYLAGVWPWWDGPVAMAFGNALGVPLFGALGALWLRVRRGGAGMPSVATAQQTRSTRDLSAWTAGLVAFGVAVAWVFGPTTTLRRGVAVGPPDPDLFVVAAQRIDLGLDLSVRLRPRLRVTTTALPERGSSFVRGRTAVLDSAGPSTEGARHLTDFIATWNLDGATVGSVTAPRRTGAAWQWDAELEALPDSFMVRLWPLTWIPESHIATLEIFGTDVEITGRAAGTAGTTVQRTSGGSAWRRPPEMTAIDSFAVERH